MKVGDSVYTPRFCTVRISAVFENERDARVAGFCEPTYYKGDHIILGKSLDMYSMEFAAIPRGMNHAQKP